MTRTSSTIEYLSESSTGRPIAVAATSTPGTLIHTAAATSAAKSDLVSLTVTNTAGGDRTLTLEWGGATTADQMVFTLGASETAVQIVSGMMLGNALEGRAFASGANELNIVGSVTRLVEQ